MMSQFVMSNSDKLKVSSRRRQLAYTLIELLFVVVIMAIMAVVAVRFVSAKADEAKIQLAAKQMNNWLQAGLQYYASHDMWPQQTDLNATYLSGVSNNQKNPWNNDYTASSTGARAGQFIVTTKVPNAQLADRLIAVLGMADKVASTGGSYDVRAYAGSAVAPPPPRTVIKGVGKGEPSVVSDGSKLGAWKTEGDGTGVTTANNSDKLYKEAPITIPRPSCPDDEYGRHYTPKYGIYLNGYQRGCYLEHKSKKLYQCDEGCTTAPKYCNQMGDDPIELCYPIIGCTDFDRRTKDDVCCPDGHVMADWIQDNTYCNVIPQYADYWQCSQYGAMDDLGYLAGPALGALAGARFGGAGLAAGTVAGIAAATYLDSIMQSKVGIVDDVLLCDYNDGKDCKSITVDNTLSAWHVYVTTQSKKPDDRVIGMDYVKQFFTNWLTHEGTFGAEANYNYRGDVTFVTYCEPIP